MSRVYTSIAAILIESAAPFSIIGIGVVITTAQKGPPALLLSYIWGIFCVESFHSPFPSTKKTNLTELYLCHLLGSLPTNDHPPGDHGPWVAQGDCKGYQYGNRLRGTGGPREKSGGTCHDLSCRDPHIWSRNAWGRVGCVSRKGRGHSRRHSCVSRLAAFLVLVIPYSMRTQVLKTTDSTLHTCIPFLSVDSFGHICSLRFISDTQFNVSLNGAWVRG